MKKRGLSVFLTLAMALALLPAPAVSAKEVIYQPVPLYGSFLRGDDPAATAENGRNLMLFDYNMTGAGSYNGYAAQRADFVKKGYLLNDFFKMTYWDNIPWGGKGIPLTDAISTSNKGNYSASYNAPGLWGVNDKGRPFLVGEYANFPPRYYNKISRFKDTPANGNIINMLAKGDVEFTSAYEAIAGEWEDNYFFYKDVYPLPATASFFGSREHITDKSWVSRGYAKNGTMNMTGWRTGMDIFMNALGFTTYGTTGGRKHPAKLRNIMVVGRDIKGPKVVNAGVYRENPVKNGFMDWDISPADALRVGDVGKTAYVALTFDEPVKFKDSFATAQNTARLQGLTLDIETIGLDGGTAMKAAAEFYSFAPSKYTALPVMLFKYTVKDEAAAAGRGNYYEFTSLRINRSDNRQLFESITDIAGNPLGAVGGVQVEQRVNMPVRTIADFRPLTLERASLAAGDRAFVAPYTKGVITLRFSKEVKFGRRVPSIVLNVRDGRGDEVVIEPQYGAHDWIRMGTQWYPHYQSRFQIGEIVSGKVSDSDSRKTAVVYPFYFLSNYSMEPGEEYIKIKRLELDSGIYDEAGYQLTNESPGMQNIAFDRSYRLDHVAPEVTIGELSGSPGTVYTVPLSAVENTPEGLEGQAAAVRLRAGIDFSYQITDGGYDEDGWLSTEGGAAVYSTPLDTPKELTVKLPAAYEISNLTVGLSIEDKAGNKGTKEQLFRLDADNTPPRIRVFRKDHRTAEVWAQDRTGVRWEALWTDAGSTPSETDWQGAEGGTEKMFDVTDSIDHTGNQLYQRELHIRAWDEKDNLRTHAEGGFILDNRYPDVKLTPNAPTDRLISGLPSVTVDYINMPLLEYAWLEVPDMENFPQNYAGEVKQLGIGNTDWQRFTPEDPSRGTLTIAAPAREYDYEQGGVNYIFRAFEGAFNHTIGGSAELQHNLKWFLTPGNVYTPNSSFYATPFANPWTLNRPLALAARTGGYDGDYQLVTFNTLNSFNNTSEEYLKYWDDSGQQITSGRTYNVSPNASFHLAVMTRDKDANPVYVEQVARPEHDLALSGWLTLGRGYGGEEIDFAGGTRLVLEKITTPAGGGASAREEVYSVPLTRESLTLDYANGKGGTYRFKEVVPYTLLEDAVDGEGNTVRYQATMEVMPKPAWSLETGREVTHPALVKSADEFEISEYPISGGISGWLDGSHAVANLRTEGDAVADGISGLLDSDARALFRWLDGAPTVANLRTEGDAVVDGTLMAQYLMTDTENPMLLAHGLDGYGFDRSATLYWSRLDGLKKNAAGEIVFDTDDYEKVMSYSVYQYSYDEYGALRAQKEGFENAMLGEVFYINELGEGALLQDGRNVFYYQLESSLGVKSPIYTIVIEKDAAPPEISFSASPAREEGMTNQSVSVTPRIAGAVSSEITAVYDDGAVVEEARSDGEGTGVYVFERGGSITVRAEDSAGNTAREIYAVDYIDKEAPVISGLQSQSDSQIRLTAAVSGAREAAVRFDSAYMRHLTGNEEEWLPVGTAFPGMLESALSDGALALRAVSKSGVDPSSVTVRAWDAAGNQAEQTIALSVRGASPGVADTVYTYGAPLRFTVPVMLTSHTSDRSGYADEHSALSIYTDGVHTVSYTDLFGRAYRTEITSEILGEAYRHTVSASETAPTTGTVTVSADASDNGNLYITDVPRGSDPVVIDGKTYYKTASAVFAENGQFAYTLAVLSPDRQSVDGNFAPRGMSYRVSNIDKTPPRAMADRVVNGTELVSIGDDGEVIREVYGTVSYEIIGFDESGVTMRGGAPVSHTFSEAGSHIFTFADPAGNEGTYTADESETVFRQASDLVITGCRVKYYVGGVFYGYGSGNDTTFLPLTNQDITAVVEAVNQSGGVVPAAMSVDSQGEGCTYIPGQSTLVFTQNARTAVTLTGGAGSASLTLDIQSIDKAPPRIQVNYMPREDGSVQAYIITDKEGAVILNSGVLTDENGLYLLFSESGGVTVAVRDRAGNIATAVAGVYSIDKTPPRLSNEKWLNDPDAVTAGSIRLYLLFDEVLRSVDVEALDASELRHANTDDYIGYHLAGSALTLEFKQNCRAKVVAYDVKGNAFTLFRPNDGMISVIDKTPPAVTVSKAVSPGREKVTVTYTITNEAAVHAGRKITDAAGNVQYFTEYVEEYEYNGVYTAAFADRAGNVTTARVEITEIDDVTPDISYSLKSAGGQEIFYSDGRGNTGAVAVASDVTLAVASSEPCTVTIVRAGAGSGGLTAQYDGANDVIYPISENGRYEVSVSDAAGNKKSIQLAIGFIDREPPVLRFASTTAVEVIQGTAYEAVRERLLEGVSARDAFSGDCDVETGGFTAGDLAAPGQYTVTYRAKDALGNAAAQTRKLVVYPADGVYFTVNGSLKKAGATVTVPERTIAVAAPEQIADAGGRHTLSWAKGNLTQGQMKYAPLFEGGFTVPEPGFYTVMAQNEQRKAYLIRIYVSR